MTRTNREMCHVCGTPVGTPEFQATRLLATADQNCKFTSRTLGEEDTCMEVDARNKLGTRNWKCFAGTRLWAIGKLLREMRPDGTLFCRVPWIFAPCSYFIDVL